MKRMNYLDFTYPNPLDNIALDEALLQLCEMQETQDEILRFWESNTYFAVLGRSRKIHADLKLDACRKSQVPIYRRSRGGGTVLQGPGCLNYALILRQDRCEQLAGITSAYRYVLANHAAQLSRFLHQPVTVAGVSDLVVDKKKISGNAQYRKKRFLLIHGTFLCSFDLGKIASFLPIPAEQPNYRGNRMHGDFLRNLDMPCEP
ncbi:lipoate--protein ligase family protein, partial [bacterium]|nr:lipoate--protein ligase family protein [bacterium]